MAYQVTCDESEIAFIAKAAGMPPWAVRGAGARQGNDESMSAKAVLLSRPWLSWLALALLSSAAPHIDLQDTECKWSGFTA